MSTKELIDNCLSDSYIPYLDLFNEVEQLTSNFEKDKTQILLDEVNNHVTSLPIEYRYKFVENGKDYSRKERTHLGLLFMDNVNAEQVYQNKNIYQMVTCIEIQGVEVYSTPQIVNFQNLQHIIFTREPDSPTGMGNSKPNRRKKDEWILGKDEAEKEKILEELHTRIGDTQAARACPVLNEFAKNNKIVHRPYYSVIEKEFPNIGNSSGYYTQWQKIIDCENKFDRNHSKSGKIPMAKDNRL